MLSIHLTRRALAVSIVALVLVAGLSACGSSGSSGTTTSGSTGAQFQARLNLAKCFRSHGINVPDPSSGGGAAGGGGIFRELRNYSQAQVTAAREACNKYFAQAFPRLNTSPAQQAQFRQQLVKFAECMRSHGVDVPDPSTSGGGFGIGRAFRSVDRNSPAFQAANKACSSLRPQFGRGGTGGPGGGAAPAGGGPSE